MKTIKDFSAFKLNKKQMGAMKGGTTYQCVVGWADGDTFNYQITTDLDLSEVIDQVHSQLHDGPTAVGCEPI